MAAGVSKDTWAGRRTAWNQVNSFLQAHGLPPLALDSLPSDPTMVLMALLGLRIKESTRLAYTGAIKAIYLAMGTPFPSDLEHFRKVTQTLASRDTRTPAVPITRQQVDKAMEIAPTQMIRLAIWLAWKTASRLDEIEKLTPLSFMVISEEEIIISWTARRTVTETPGVKSAHKNKYAVRFFTQIRDREPMSWQAALLNARRLPRRSKLFPSVDRQITNLISAIPLSEEQQQMVTDYEMLNHLTGHSFKRGAGDVLLARIAAKELPPNVYSLMLKHKTATQDEVAEVSVMYGHHNPNIARMTGTGCATLLL